MKSLLYTTILLFSIIILAAHTVIGSSGLRECTKSNITECDKVGYACYQEKHMEKGLCIPSKYYNLIFTKLGLSTTECL